MLGVYRQMILYKYRSLQNLNHILDILHHSRLYCARYLALNDPFEGLFSTTIHIPPHERVKFPFFLLPETYTLTKSVNDLFLSSRDGVRICSLSSSLIDVRLWSHYADGYRGVALEIDFSGVEDSIHQVKYSEELPSYGYTILTAPSPIEVLTRKTIHWNWESEFRIIHEEEYFDISGRLKAIYVGSRIKDTHLALLDKMKRSDIPIIHTEIDSKKIEIRAKKNTEQGGAPNLR
jgi:hypothetical protein